MSNAGGFIYAIGVAGTTWIKIGRAINVQQRLLNLQLGNPIKLEVRAVVPVSADMYDIEDYVHIFFAEEWRRGEWFDIRMDTIQLEALIIQSIASFREHREQNTCPAETIQLLGKKVWQKRKALGLQQGEVARRTGISVKSLYDIESWREAGRVEVRKEYIARAFTVKRLEVIAQALHTTTDYLLGREEESQHEMENAGSE